ncbi:MAG: hypothetical protein FWD44_03300 [Oscillospiraceae bacterium]|nr:hypothetical protein [Oscillospiraceae bacterium]
MSTTIDLIIEQNINGIDDNLIDEAINAKEHLRTRRKIKRAVISSVCGAAACFLCIFGLMTWSSLSGGDIDLGSDYIPEFTGLPIAEPCVSEHEEINFPNVLKDSRRWMPRTLIDFFDREFEPHAFAFVQVTAIEEWTNKQKSQYYTDIYDMQTSTLKVLSVIRSDRAIPESLSIDQGKLVGVVDNISGKEWESIIKCGCSGSIMFLREGGVYILPLWKQGSSWYTTDSDVLFEVDDEGLIFSHTWLSGFNKYDGKPASQLAYALVNITEDEDFELATSRFAAFVSEIWNTVLDVTILPETNGKDVVAAIENILVRPDKAQVDKLLEFYAQNNEYYEERNYDYLWQWENGSVIEAQAYTTWLFEPGNRYIVIFNLLDKIPYIWTLNSVAKVNADGTISPYNNSTTFSWYEGVENYTIEQITDIARRLTEFFEKY